MTSRTSATRFLLSAAVGMAAASSVHAAVAPPVEPVDMRYDWADREVVEVAPVSAACPVHLLPTQDLRQNTDTVGAAISGPLVVGNLGPWVDAGLGALKHHGMTVHGRNPGEATPDGVAVRMSLTRAYTWQVGLKIFSMVALKATFTDRQGNVHTKHYRGHGDKTNMWGAQSEYVTTLNYGMNNVLPVVARDVAALCRNEAIESYTYAGPAQPVKK